MEEATRVLAKTTVQRTLNLLSDPSRWTKHVSALDEGGSSVNPRSEKAACWCLSGALEAASFDTNGQLTANSKLTQAVRDRGYVSVPAFNDSADTSHADVIDVLSEVDARL
jgi:hypothetical protein